jgi:hypothetical protein
MIGGQNNTPRGWLADARQNSREVITAGANNLAQSSKYAKRGIEGGAAC